MLALLSAVQRWPSNNNNNRIQGTNSQQLRLYFNSLTLLSHLNTSLLALHLSKTIAARSIHLFYTHRNGANTIKPGAKRRHCSLRYSGSRLQSEPVYSAGVTGTEIKRCYRVKLNRGFWGDDVDDEAVKRRQLKQTRLRVLNVGLLHTWRRFDYSHS